VLPNTKRQATDPFVPKPSGEKVVLFHLAILLQGTPFAVVKSPATISSLLKMVSALTWALVPEPKGVQLCAVVIPHRIRNKKRNKKYSFRNRKKGFILPPV
jgi:hypothetical protein